MLDLNHIEYAECKSLHEEALCIFIQRKEILDSFDKKITIISDLPQLIQMILSISKVFDIKINNRSGVPMKELDHVDFIRLIAETVQQNFSPIYLLALIRHKMFAFNKKEINLDRLIKELEQKYLSGIRRYDNLEELIEFIDENQLRGFLWLLKEEFKNFTSLMSKASASIQDILKELSSLAIRIANPLETSIYRELAQISMNTNNIMDPETFLNRFDSLIENERIH